MNYNLKLENWYSLLFNDISENFRWAKHADEITHYLVTRDTSALKRGEILDLETFTGFLENYPESVKYMIENSVPLVIEKKEKQ